MGRSMVHRLLQGWVDLGYVRKNAESEYFATLKLWEIGMRLIGQLDVRVAARPVMSRLLESTGETVQLTVLQELDVVYIETMESRAPVRSSMAVGAKAPAHCAATGKVMLAFSDYESMLTGLDCLARYSRTTITDLQDFRRELQQIQAQGFAVNRGEWREEVRGLAAPIFDARNQVVAGLGISTPAARLKPAAIRKYAPLLVSAAQEISRTLGGMA